MTADEKDSAALAMNSGCDLDAGRFYKHLVDAVHRGKVSQQRLDEAVTNLLATASGWGSLANTRRILTKFLILSWTAPRW